METNHVTVYTTPQSQGGQPAPQGCSSHQERRPSFPLKGHGREGCSGASQGVSDRPQDAVVSPGTPDLPLVPERHHQNWAYRIHNTQMGPEGFKISLFPPDLEIYKCSLWKQSVNKKNYQQRKTYCTVKHTSLYGAFPPDCAEMNKEPFPFPALRRGQGSGELTGGLLGGIGKCISPFLYIPWAIPPFLL